MTSIFADECNIESFTTLKILSYKSKENIRSARIWSKVDNNNGYDRLSDIYDDSMTLHETYLSNSNSNVSYKSLWNEWVYSSDTLTTLSCYRRHTYGDHVYGAFMSGKFEKGG